MPKPRVLIDTNIILDYVLERQPFHAEAEGIILRLAKNEFVGYISGITAINVYYTGRKLKGKDYTLKAVRRLLRLTEVCATEKKVLQNAFLLNFNDISTITKTPFKRRARRRKISTRLLRATSKIIKTRLCPFIRRMIFFKF